MLDEKAVIDDEFLLSLEGKVIGYALDLNIKGYTDARYIEAVRALTELRRRLKNLGVTPKAIVIISHRGRPDVKAKPEDVENPKFRVEQVAEWLSRKKETFFSEGGIGEEVKVISETTPEALEKALEKAKGEIYFLQNTRLNPLITKNADDAKELKSFAGHFDAFILGDWGRSGKGDLRGISSFVPAVLDSIAFSESKVMIKLMSIKEPMLTILAGIKEEKAEVFKSLVERHKEGSTIWVLGPTGYTVQSIIEGFVLGNKTELGRSKLVISEDVLDMLRQAYEGKLISKDNPVIDEGIKKEIRGKILEGITDEKQLKDREKKLKQEFKIVESVIQGWYLAESKDVKVMWAKDHLVTEEEDFKKGKVEEDSEEGLTEEQTALFFGEQTSREIIESVKKYENIYIFGAPGLFENPGIGDHEYNNQLLGTLEVEKKSGEREVSLFGGDTDIWAQGYSGLPCSTGGGASLQTWLGEEPVILVSAWYKKRIKEYIRKESAAARVVAVKAGEDKPKIYTGEDIEA
ncbi:MAG: phosphoglycerate kinase, partial [Candidatus Omnitrophica bacterium]|nr:phosphoglycerate kinase [Candidatus Omnitrophota bacterium]